MVPVNVYSLIITEHPAPSLLLLCPDEDTVGKTQIWQAQNPVVIFSAVTGAAKGE